MANNKTTVESILKSHGVWSRDLEAELLRHMVEIWRSDHLPKEAKRANDGK